MKERKMLIDICSKVIGLPDCLLEELIKQNKTAKYFLENEKMLKATSDLENLKILVRFLLFREYGDLSPISNDDINFIYKNYKIYGSFSNDIIYSKCYNEVEIINLFEDYKGI